uniref:Uncharacterized protein n=1 Tax=Tanacetum cinerariifolium TaxID=118510 RepID=A0A699I7F1_TANCI|nr:hypothetical protein [Tanacetum cinerariifolium]
MLFCKQEEAGIQLNAEQTEWKDDTDDESEDQELEAHYIYMAQIQEISPDAADSGPIFDVEPLQKVSNDDHYNVFAIESEHPEQPESINDTNSIEQYEHNMIITSLDMSYDREQINQNDDDNDLANERELLASLIEKLKCKIDDSKNRNKFLETSNKVSPDAVDSGPIFDKEPEQKVQNDVHYDVFAIECQHPEQSGSVHKTYLIEQDVHNVIIKSEDMNYGSEQIDQNDEDADLAEERELLASLIAKLKCEIDESKNRNTLLETSNKILVEKLKSEIADFKNKNKSLTEANNKLSKENDLLFADFMKLKAELKRRDNIEYASEIELECAKVKGEFYTYKKESQMSCVKYTQTINDLNQTISEMKNKLFAHQDTISVLKQQKDAQIKLYKSREDK